MYIYCKGFLSEMDDSCTATSLFVFNVLIIIIIYYLF